MYKAFQNLTTQESAGYGLLCVFFAKGIDYMDKHMPERAMNVAASEQTWNGTDKRAAAASKAS